MTNENSTGYQILDLRVSEVEKDVKSVTSDLREHIRKNDDEHKEMRANIAESTLSVREIKLMITQMAGNSEEMKRSFKETSNEIKDEVKALRADSNKEKGWRGIIVDILKVIILLIGFIATGKFIL